VRWYLPTVATILITVAIVLTALSLTAVALIAAWLVGSFSVDRLLTVVGAGTGVTGLLVTVSVPLGRWMLTRSRRE